MYRDFYQMKRGIFTVQPHPDVFFESKVHKGAWDYLLSGIGSQEPFMLVTGDYGTGKTLLCLKFISILQKENTYPVVYVPSANYSFKDILHQMVNRLGLVVQGRGNSSLQSLLYENFYLAKEEELKPIYVIIDEANEFDPSILDKLRALANFNRCGIFPIHLIFFGHTSFLDMLKSPSLTALDQRIRRRYHLTPFNFMETKEYIYFQLLISGASGSPYFSNEALQQIFAYSGGIPRLINTICDASLLIGSARGLKVIESYVTEEAIKSLEGPNRKREEQDTLPLDEEKAEYGEMGETEREEKGLQTEKGGLLKRIKLRMILYFLLLLSLFLIGFFLRVFLEG